MNAYPHVKIKPRVGALGSFIAGAFSTYDPRQAGISFSPPKLRAHVGIEGNCFKKVVGNRVARDYYTDLDRSSHD